VLVTSASCVQHSPRGFLPAEREAMRYGLHRGRRDRAEPLADPARMDP